MKTNQKHDTVAFMKSLCHITYLCCSHNFWFEDLFSPMLRTIYSKLSKVLEAIVITLIASEWGAFFTQRNLNAEQEYSMYIYGLSHPVIYAVYANCVYYRDELRELVWTLAVRLKGLYNDRQIDRTMVDTTARYLAGFVVLCSFTLLSYGFGNGVQSLTSNATFVTVIPVWPNVEDRSPTAGVARVLYYIAWWILVIRLLSVYFIILAVTISLSTQFKILCKYFENLNDVFKGTESQAEKEMRYINGFNVGIKMHSITLWCTRQTQQCCGVAFSGQVTLNVSVLMLLMIQMMYMERTLLAVMSLLLMAASVLIGTGVFMWNAGDVTVEASRLPNAMFFSGWHNCQHSSLRARKLVTIAMAQAQRRVVVKGFGFVELSYESYVKIVKSSYSLFSVIY